MAAEHEWVEVNDRAEWRRWLEAHHEQTESIWLVAHKKHVPERYLAFDDMVQEALCFGWIDSQVITIDADRTRRRLSPRRPNSIWSAVNKRHVEHLEATGQMTDAGRHVIERAKADGSWTFLDDIEAGIIPDDLRDALAEDPAAEALFLAMSHSRRKHFLYWVKSAKRAPTRAERIVHTLRCMHAGLKEPQKVPE